MSVLKAQPYQDAHTGKFNSLDEQAFIVSVVNAVPWPPFRSSTTVILVFDDFRWLVRSSAGSGAQRFVFKVGLFDRAECVRIPGDPVLEGRARTAFL